MNDDSGFHAVLPMHESRPEADRCLSLPTGDELVGDAADERLAELAKAVAHPARVRILRLLLERDACLCGQICDELPLAQSTISQHLKVLREAGLVTACSDGPRVCYEPNPGTLALLGTLLTALAGGRGGRA
jgi:ArsR family transcriptional regulator, arsenate/arsenite/antimonite-responsive transcriptional repressor